MKTFRTLELAVEFYQAVEELELKGHLSDQLIRASSSIALNLSEGNAKGTIKDKKRYFHTAYASLRECQTIFKLANLKNQGIDGKADHLGACLYKLLRSEIRLFSVHSGMLSVK